MIERGGYNWWLVGLIALAVSCAPEVMETGSDGSDVADTAFRPLPSDQGVTDAGQSDGGAVEAGDAAEDPGDAGQDVSTTPDTGSADTGQRDTGADSSTGDTGAVDTGSADTGTPDTGPADTGPPDAGPADTGPADTGTTGDAVDPCEGLTPCPIPTESSSCDDDTVVRCERHFNGCYFETRFDCEATGQVCEVSGGSAACQTPSTGTGGETCSEAEPIAAGTHAIDTTGYRNDYETYDGACDGFLDTGPDRVFTVTLSPGSTLTASATTTSDGPDVVLAISASCPDIGATCLDYSDESIFLYPEVVSVTNTTGSNVTYYLIVDGWGPSDIGVSTLTVTIS